MKKYFAILMIVIGSQNVYCQSTNIDSIRNQLRQINRFYDSASYLSFDVDISYNTDTVLGKYEADRQLAHYALNGNNIYYNVGEMEFMQNNSFAITAYSGEKMMAVDGQKNQQASSLLPVKEFSDSVLNYFFGYYTVAISDTGGQRVISFRSDSVNVPYKDVSIYYDPEHYLLSKIEMTSWRSPIPPDHPDSIPVSYSLLPSMIQTHMTMEFHNYSFMDNADIFNAGKYIYFDRQRKAYMAIGKYRGYRLLTTNLDDAGTQYDDIETPVSNNPQ